VAPGLAREEPGPGLVAYLSLAPGRSAFAYGAPNSPGLGLPSNAIEMARAIPPAGCQRCEPMQLTLAKVARHNPAGRCPGQSPLPEDSHALH